MQLILQFFILIPLAGFVLSLMIPEKNEDLISTTSFSMVGVNLAGILAAQRPSHTRSQLHYRLPQR